LIWSAAPDKKSVDASYTPIGVCKLTSDADPVRGNITALTWLTGVKVGIAINYKSPLIK